jgi:hypothetical protein
MRLLTLLAVDHIIEHLSNQLKAYNIENQELKHSVLDLQDKLQEFDSLKDSVQSANLEVKTLSNEKRELLERVQTLKHSVSLSPQERSQQVLRSFKALQQKTQELTLEKMEHNQTKQKLMELQDMLENHQLLDKRTTPPPPLVNHDKKPKWVCST